MRRERTAAHDSPDWAEIRGTSRSSLIGTTIGFFAGFAAIAVFGPTALCFATVMRLSPMQLGWLIATPALSGSLLRIPCAAWADRVGARRPFLLLLSLETAAMIGLFVTLEFLYPDRLSPRFYDCLLGLGVLSGCGVATFSVGASQVAYWHQLDRQGAALAIYAGFGNMAPGLFSLGVPLALANASLATVYLGWLVLLIGGTVIYALIGRDAAFFQFAATGMPLDAAVLEARLSGQAILPGREPDSLLAHAARRWQTWALVALYFIGFGGFLALTSWMPTYWNRNFGLSIAWAGGLTALFSLLASLTRVGAGMLSDRVGGERLVTIALGALMLAAFRMTHAATVSSAIAGTIVLAMAMGVINAGVFQMVPHYVPKAVGGAAGLVGGVGALGGFFLPPAMMWFAGRADQHADGAGFVVFVILAAAGLVIATLLSRHPQVAASAVSTRAA